MLSHWLQSIGMFLFSNLYFKIGGMLASLCGLNQKFFDVLVLCRTSYWVSDRYSKLDIL